MVDTIVDPNAAFESIRIAPAWGWALTALCVLTVAGYAMERPAALHAAVGTIEHMLATSTMFSSLTDAQKQAMVDAAEHPTPIQSVVGAAQVIAVYAIGILFNTSILLAGNAIGEGTANFRRLWAGSVNIAVPTLGLSAVVLGVIALMRGAASFHTTSDLINALPNLGWAFPGLHGRTAGFFAALNVFLIWGLFLNIAMMRKTAQVRGMIAWVFPLLITLVGALLSGMLSAAAG
jgi:hypothetical protein